MGYQWTRDGTNIAGATGSTYTVFISRVAVSVSRLLEGRLNELEFARPLRARRLG
jgi:hypothetical protein